jgi:hypothetical protein
MVYCFYAFFFQDEGKLNEYKLEPTTTLFGNKTSSQNSFFGGTPSAFPLKDAGFTFGKVSKDKSEGCQLIFQTNFP